MSQKLKRAITFFLILYARKKLRDALRNVHLFGTVCSCWNRLWDANILFLNNVVFDIAVTVLYIQICCHFKMCTRSSHSCINHERTEYTFFKKVFSSTGLCTHGFYMHKKKSYQPYGTPCRRPRNEMSRPLWRKNPARAILGWKDLSSNWNDLLSFGVRSYFQLNSNCF